MKPAAKTFRVAVMGPPMSGKSALVKRYLTQQGTEGYNADHQSALFGNTAKALFTN